MLNSTSAGMPRKPAASHTGTPRCISQVAAVWRSVRGVTWPWRPAKPTALLKDDRSRQIVRVCPGSTVSTESAAICLRALGWPSTSVAVFALFRSRIHATHLAAAAAIAPVWARFASTYPDVHLEILVETRPIDITSFYDTCQLGDTPERFVDFDRLSRGRWVWRVSKAK